MQLVQDLKIHLDETIDAPIYRQIAEQIQQGIASNQIILGQRLPAVRQLAHELGVNTGTVFRAYMELEQSGVVKSHRGSGTMVTIKSDDPTITRSRQQRLSSLVNSQILGVLSQGFSPEELDAAFSLHLSRWRDERQSQTENVTEKKKSAKRQSTFVIVASHDPVLNILTARLKKRKPNVKIGLTYSGSLGGLIALQENRADMAGIHLLDEETGEYNYPYIKHLLAGQEVAVVNLSYRIQGLMFTKHNPKHITGFNDLKRNDIRFINRQSGSGTRVLLDLELRKHNIDHSMIKGYEKEMDTHHGVATLIARGEADVGLGIEAAANTSGLDFLPLVKEKYDLVIPLGKYKSRIIKALMDILTSRDFKTLVAKIGGYDTSRTGFVTFLR